MPIYEYECTVCNQRTELLQKVSDAPLDKCPECEGAVRKVVSPAGLHFKGSGWYITDYAKKNGQAASSPKSDGKRESSPAKKEGTSNKPASGSKE